MRCGGGQKGLGNVDPLTLPSPFCKELHRFPAHFWRAAPLPRPPSAPPPPTPLLSFPLWILYFSQGFTSW